MVNNRDTLIKEYIIRLGTIIAGDKVTVNGVEYTYQTSIGNKVYLRREAPFGIDEMPAINVHPGPMRNRESGGEVSRPLRILPLATNIVVADVTDEETNKIVEDIMKCIGSDPRNWGVIQARWTTVELLDPIFEEESQLVATLPILAEISYRTELWDI